MARYDFQSSLNSDQTKTKAIVVGDDYTSALTRAVATISRISDSWSRGDVLSSSGPIDTLESALARSVDVSSDQRVFIDMCREAIDATDVAAGVEPTRTAQFFVKVMTRVTRMLASGQSHTSTLQHVLNDVLRCRKHLRAHVRRCNKTDFNSMLMTVDQRHRQAVADAFEVCGASGRLIMSTASTRENMTSIKVTNDYVFDIVSPYTTTWLGDDINLDMPRVLTVDGFIESVAEIDHILSEVVATNSSLVIFARRFDPDVISTISHNNHRGTFKVVPIVVPYDADSANVLKDIAVVCGGDVISSLLGQLLSSVKLDDLPIIDHFKADALGVYMTNDATVGQVRAHIQTLSESLKRDDNEISHGFITQRIRCMSNRLIHLRVHDVNQRRVLSVDRGVRLLNVALKRGVIDVEHLKKLDSITLNELLTCDDRHIYSIDELDQQLLRVGGLVRLLGTSNCLLQC